MIATAFSAKIQKRGPAVHPGISLVGSLLHSVVLTEGVVVEAHCAVFGLVNDLQK